MKNVKSVFLFLFMAVFFVACSKDEFLEDSSVQLSKIETSLEEGTFKDEINVEKASETMADEKFVQQIKNTIDNSFGIRSVSLAVTDFYGVLKVSTCGGNDELSVFMDCQDGGWTNIAGNVGSSYVDGNKNLHLNFCMIPGKIFSGTGCSVLTLGKLQNTNIGLSYQLVRRYHDNEDSNNTNKTEVVNKGIVWGALGESVFDKNTLLSWQYNTGSQPSGPNLGFRYGVVARRGAPVLAQYQVDGTINIDDENSGNANWVDVKTAIRTPSSGWQDAIHCSANTSYDVVLLN